jgi:hypothetical protein
MNDRRISSLGLKLDSLVLSLPHYRSTHRASQIPYHALAGAGPASFRQSWGEYTVSYTFKASATAVMESTESGISRFDRGLELSGFSSL